MVSAARRKIVFQSIKSALIKGVEFEYWVMKMYEQLDAGVLTNAQVEELEIIIEEHYAHEDEPEVIEEEAEQLEEEGE